LTHPVKQTAGEIFLDQFELESVIPIQTTKDFLLSGINRVICHKAKIIILDSNTTSIFVIDANTGKVEARISRKGRGPGESLHIIDIAFDERTEQILAFNDYNKLLYFNLNGAFLKEEKITDELFSEIICDSGKVIFYNASEGYGCFPYSTSSYDLQDKSWEKAGKDTKVDFPVRGYGCLLVRSKNIWFTPVLDFGLHLLNDGEIEIPYILDQKPLSDEVREKSVSDIASFYHEVSERDILYSIHSVRETERFIIFKSNRRNGFLMMNKKESKLFWEEYVKDANLGLELTRYFPHNSDDNRVMFVVHAYEWVERSLHNSDSTPEQTRKKIDNVKVTEESNPILIFYREK
jgi:hypothetical protein